MARKTRTGVRGATQKTRKRVRTRAQLNKRIGKRVRAERLQRDLTLQELSDRVGLSTSGLSQMELGKNAVSIWALVRIADSLGVHVSEFLSDV